MEDADPLSEALDSQGRLKPEFALGDVGNIYHAKDFRRITEGIAQNFFQGRDPYPLEGIIESDEKEQSDLLHHYTTLSGFMGIINSRSLLMTNLMSVNDGAEIFGLFDSAERLVRRSMAGIEDRELRAFLRFAVARMRYYGWGEPPRSYVSSFTSESDSTLQWQTYGHADGVCLSFSGNRLRYEISGFRNHRLYRCIYNEGKRAILLKDMMRGLIQNWTEHVSKYPIDFSDGSSWLIRAHAVMFAYAPFFGMIKNKDFSHEKEWRIIYYRPFTPERRDVEAYRHANGYLSTRYRFNLGRRNGAFFKNGLKRVLIGPSPHSSQHQQLSTKFAVERVLKDNGIQAAVEISKSTLRATV